MQNKIVAIVGMPGSGKSEVTKYLEKKGFIKVYFGDATFDEIKRRGLETNSETEKMIREGLRKKYGMGAFAILNMPRIKKAYEKGDVVIESMYSWDEYKKVKEKYGNRFKVIAVCAQKNMRHERTASRKQQMQSGVRKFTKEQVAQRDVDQIENTATGGPIAIADYTIINEGTLEELYKNLDVVSNKINKDYLILSQGNAKFLAK